MWSLQHQLLFISAAALTCKTSAEAVIHVFGYKDKSVQLSCSYGEGYENYEKYLCNKNCDWEDVLIKTSETAKDKYSISDDKTTRIFRSTINDLQFTDAGTYWCAVEKNGKDIYTELLLEIRQDSCCDNMVKVQSYEEGSVSIECPYESQDRNNLKYICKGQQPSTCLQKAIVTSEAQQSSSFRLTDTTMSQKFTVNIERLTRGDSGRYLCGVHRSDEFDVFSAVELEVKGWCCETTKRATGTLGRSLTLHCPYPSKHYNKRKFLCKGSQRRSCADVTGSQRFSLHSVSSSSFQVTISKLEAGDAGIYWCGSDSDWSVADYTKIDLSVVILQQTSTVKTVEFSVMKSLDSSVEPEPGKDVTSYIVYIVPAALMILLIIILILTVVVCMRKRRRDKGTELAANINKVNQGCMQDVMGAADIYENHDTMLMHVKVTSSKHQDVCQHYDNVNAEEDYENFRGPEEIYTNEFYHKDNKR